MPSAASPATVKSGKSAAFPPDHVRVQSTVPAVSSAPSARGAAACSRRVPSAIASAVAASVTGVAGVPASQSGGVAAPSPLPSHFARR